VLHALHSGVRLQWLLRQAPVRCSARHPSDFLDRLNQPVREERRWRLLKRAFGSSRAISPASFVLLSGSPLELRMVLGKQAQGQLSVMVGRLHIWERVT
jgi:hypothetical protein